MFPGKTKGKHTCKSVKGLEQPKESANSGEIMIERETQNLAVSIIKKYYRKTFFHSYNYFQNANINLNDTWIKNQLKNFFKINFHQINYIS